MSDDQFPSIRQLTKQMAAGDKAAISAFYAEFFDFMFAEACHATQRDEHLCLDVVQEAMLRVMRKIRPLESRGHLVAWVRRLVWTVSYDQLRSETRRRRREARRTQHQQSWCTASEIQRELEGMHERLEWLTAQLRSLNKSERSLLSARYRSGLTLYQIGRNIGMSSSAVDGRIRRLLAKLRKSYVESRDEEDQYPIK